MTRREASEVVTVSRFLPVILLCISLFCLRLYLPLAWVSHVPGVRMKELGGENFNCLDKQSLAVGKLPSCQQYWHREPEAPVFLQRMHRGKVSAKPWPLFIAHPTTSTYSSYTRHYGMWGAKPCMSFLKCWVYFRNDCRKLMDAACLLHCDPWRLDSVLAE